MGCPFFMIPMILKLIKTKRGAYDKLIYIIIIINGLIFIFYFFYFFFQLIYILLRFIADKGRAFFLVFRLLNVDNIFPVKIPKHVTCFLLKHEAFSLFAFEIFAFSLPFRQLRTWDSLCCRTGRSTTASGGLWATR